MGAIRDHIVGPERLRPVGASPLQDLHALIPHSSPFLLPTISLHLPRSPTHACDLPRYCCRILQNAVHFRCSAAFSRFHHSKATLPTPFLPLCGAGVAWDHRKRPMGSIAALSNIILHARVLIRMFLPCGGRIRYLLRLVMRLNGSAASPSPAHWDPSQ